MLNFFDLAVRITAAVIKTTIHRYQPSEPSAQRAGGRLIEKKYTVVSEDFALQEIGADEGLFQCLALR